MQLAHHSTKILISGASGMGKSTYWTRLVLGYRAQTKFVYDHEGELCLRLRVKPARTVTDLANSTASGWCIFDPEPMFGSRIEEGFNFFSEFAFTSSLRLRGTKLFACDELQQFLDCHTISPQFKDLLQRGRRRGLDAALATQAPNEIHNKHRQQITETIAFAHGEKNAIDWLEAWGFNGEELRKLRPGEFICRKRGALGQTRDRVF